MIDKEVFAQAMGLLTDRFNRPLHPGTNRLYFEILSEELDTDELTIAVRLAVRRSQFWPSPQQLIEFAKPPRDLALEAGNAFQELLKCGEVSPGHGMSWRRARVSEMGEAVLAGFDFIGANARLREMDARDLPHVRREFIEAYKSFAVRETAVGEIESARQSLIAPRRERPALASGNANGSEFTGPMLIGDVIQQMARETT